MRFMNTHDLGYALARLEPSDVPNRHALALVVSGLADWANANSDGWAYWPKPLRAAQSAIALIANGTHAAMAQQERHDISDAERKAALRPIKAFLTRQGVTGAERAQILGEDA